MTNADLNSGLKRVAREAILAQRLRNLFRIDENLTADLSYITHAEYQLFLDEKRAAGEYLQPDHWPGYTFPKSQGRLPVVGVRPADAAAFCTWLTQHDETAIVGGWRYRLPQSGELATYGLHTTEALGTVGGYWVRQDDGFTFTPLDKRMPILTMTKLQQRIEGDRARAFTRALDRALDRAFDRDLTLPLDLDRGRDLDLTLALARARDRVLDRALPLDLDHALAKALALPHANALARDRDRDRDRDLAKALAKALALDRNLLEEDQWQVLRLYLRFIFILVAGQLRLSTDKQIQASSERWLGVYIDWVILEERIEGALPAFEGIRIVKERAGG